MSVGKDIASLRMQEGLTQAELGKRLGMSRGHIAHLEADVRPPTPEALVSLAREIGLGGTGIPHESPMKKPPETLTTDRYSGRRSGRGKDPNRVSKNRYRYVDTPSTAAASWVFRKREHNPTLCWLLVVNGAVIARGSESSVREYNAKFRIGGEVIREESK